MAMYDPIRMTEFQQRRPAAIARTEAEKQFKMSAVLALVIAAASVAVAFGTVLA